ncbi:YchJ family protein [Streptosporangium sp. NPDC048047]|uniref:YchJ family protein n=1 Tax=Streptosporangium sp. NPDC048047 TaxID=3155748 RepID=UPI00341796B5
MSRRSPRSPRPSAASAGPCPCGLPAPYRDCCGRLHRGEAAAPTAEALMRSRYSAFAVGDTAYLLRTWHPRTRPPRLDLDRSLRWTGLEVLETTGGSAFHTEGTVRFRACYVERGAEGRLEEHSRFVREEGAWVYVGALPDPPAGPVGDPRL